MILTIATTKGGAGKTTTAICLATYWAQRGYLVGLVDTDRNRTLSLFFEKAHQRGKLRELLPSLRIVAETDDEQIIAAARELERGGCHVVILDVAGAASKATVYAIGVAKLVLIPSGPGGAEVDEAVRTALSVRTTAAMANRDIPHCVVLNRVKQRTAVGQHAHKQFEKHGIPLLQETLSHAVSYDEMFFSQVPPNVASPSGLSAFQIRSLARELEQRLELPPPQDGAASDMIAAKETPAMEPVHG